jgi:hypothetical protein
MSITYSIPYLVFGLYLFVMMLLEFRLLKQEKDIRFIRLGVILGFLLFFGLRGFVFSDWNIYYTLFEKMPTIWDGGISSVFNQDFTDYFSADAATGKAGMEKGFIYFTLFFKSIIPNYHAFVFFNVLIDVILLNVFIKRYSPYYALSFLLFITFGGMIIECDLIRNIKAILLFLVSIKYLQERKIIPYMLLNLAGILFHSSAIVFLPLYFILHKECPIWLMWVIFILGNIIMLFKLSYIQPILLYIGDMIGGRLSVQVRVYFVLEEYNSAYGISIGYIERVLTFLILILTQKKLVQQSVHNVLFINAYILYFFVFFFLSEISIAVERLTLLFIFSYWILYPELLSLVKYVANKSTVVIAIFAFSILKITLLTQDIFTKYDNILFGIESYEVRKDSFDNYSKPN